MRVHIFFSFLLLPKFPVTLALGANVSVQLLVAVRNDARAPCVISPRVCEQQLPHTQRLSGLTSTQSDTPDSRYSAVHGGRRAVQENHREQWLRARLFCFR